MQLPSKPKTPLADEDKEKIARMILAIEAIKKETARRGLGKGKGGHGGMPCPVPGCRGRVAFIVYVFNGHLMASCSVKGCVQFRE